MDFRLDSRVVRRRVFRWKLRPRGRQHGANQRYAQQKTMFQGSLSTFVRATHPPRLVAPAALAGGASSSSRPPLDVIELSDSEDELQASTALRSERERDVCTTLRGVEVPPGWSVIGGSLLVWSHLSPAPSAQIAAFDFDDTLAKTALGGFDPNAWTNLFPHVPAMLPVETPSPLLRQRLTAAHRGRVDSQPRPHAAPGCRALLPQLGDTCWRGGTRLGFRPP